MFKKIKMRFLPLLAAVVLLMGNVVCVSAADSVLPDRANYLRFADGNAQLIQYYREPGVVGGPHHYGDYPLYFIICEDGFYIAYYLPVSCKESYVYMDYLDNKTSDGYSYHNFNRYSSSASSFAANGTTWTLANFVAWGSKFGFDKTGTYAPKSYFYTANNEEELIALFDQENSAGSFYKLYGLEQDFTEAVDFFSIPPTLPGGMKIVERVEELTQVVQENLILILPTAVFCLALVALSPALLIRLKRFL